MFRFAHPEFLYALAGVMPGLALLFFWARLRRRRAIAAFGNPALVEQLVPNAGKRRQTVKALLLSGAAAFVLLGLADPQIGTKLEEVKREGVDIIIALDVSKSMKAEDIKPNRLENAKREIAQLLDHLQNDRIGLVVFAGDAFLQLPLTTDYSAAHIFLNTIDVDVVPVPGTAIGSAIDMAAKSFMEGSKTSKAIIIITDGENHEDDAIAAAKEAASKGIVIHTIGMGSPDGGPIPIYENGVRTGFKKDDDGNVVVTKLDESMLQQLADAGGGKFVRAANGQNELDAIYKAINSMQKTELGAKVITDYEDRFQYFLALAALLLIAEYFISERRNPRLAAWTKLLAKPFNIREETTA